MEYTPTISGWYVRSPSRISSNVLNVQSKIFDSMPSRWSWLAQVGRAERRKQQLSGRPGAEVRINQCNA